MIEFKGTKGKLSVEFYDEDFYVNIVDSEGKSVAGISTTEDQIEEAKAYGILFSKAPEMFAMLKKLVEFAEDTPEFGRGYTLDSAKQLIKEATTI